MTEDLIARTVQIASNTLVEACNKAGIAPSDIRLLCSVQPRRWIPAAIAEAAGIPEGRAPNTFTELAHVGACGVVANLLAARRARTLQRGDLVALYAQGAGFTRSAALLRWTRPQ
jgi:3-oxoacyl-[acyl-carrier-protein] synthase III